MFRSLLFIPGNNERFLVKSTNLRPDILCFDLEDSVSSNDKQIARKLVADIWPPDKKTLWNHPFMLESILGFWIS